MDSSRSGLLSTLIMTVPLVVVPAMALLRPAGPVAGVSTTPLDASLDENDPLSDWDFDAFDSDNPSNESTSGKKDSNPDGIDAPLDNTQESEPPWLRKPPADDSPVFEEVPGSETPKPLPYEPDPFDPRTPSPEPADPPQNPPITPPLASPGSPAPRSPAPGSSPPEQQREELLMKQIRAQGATNTLWFSPGTTSDYGFVAFVKRESPAVSYRFEFVGATRVLAIQGVLDQLAEWRKAHPDFAP